jgi:hypothetical protein
MQRIIAMSALPLVASAALAGNVTTTWDSGTFEGWTFTPDVNAGNWEVFSTGGNPDGYVSYTDSDQGGVTPIFLYAPGSYLGDYSSFGAGAGFAYDGIWESSTQPAINAPVIRLFGASGEVAEGFGPGVNSANWDSFFIGFNEAEWNMLSGNWNDLIANVTAVALIGDNGIGSGREGGVDNFTLVVPAPSSAAILGIAGIAALRRRR